MTTLRCLFREGFLARGAYALAAYALAAGALLLYFLLCQADANPAVYAHGANPFAELVALAATPEPLPMALLGTALLSAHMALRRRGRGLPLHRFPSGS
jgi:hypothetical protein